MKYRIEPSDGHYEFRVVEQPSKQIIKAFSAIKEAKAFMRHLNMGGGFDGWTPPFIVPRQNNFVNNTVFKEEIV